MQSWLKLLFPLVLIALAVLFLGVPSVTCGVTEADHARVLI